MPEGKPILRRRRRRFRVPLPFALLTSSVVAWGLFYVFGVAWIQARQDSLVSAQELFIPRTIDLVIFVWLFWVGSAIGSFLNVVAWRMPRGESVNGRSYCPKCQTQLKARDNFPVFGWLVLGGRCRTCRLPISARYPIVEAVVGTTITLVGIFQLYRLSLPGQSVHWHGGPFWTPVVDRQTLLILVYHVVALAVSWSLGLIRFDGQRLPLRLIAFAAVALLIPMLVYPTLMIAPWQTEVPFHWRPDELYIDAWMRIITALAAAVLLGRTLAAGICPGADPKLDPLGQRTKQLIDLILIVSVPSIIVGWQAFPAVLLLACILAILSRRWLPVPGGSLGRLAIMIPIALSIQLVLWRTLHVVWFWPSVGSSPWVILTTTGLLLPVSWWLRQPAPPKVSQPTPEPEVIQE